VSEEVLTLVKIPLTQIEQSIRSKHQLPNVLVDVRLEADYLVLTFSGTPNIETETVYSTTPSVVNVRRKKRRARRKRNRMKTRGWEIVDSMVNSKGQTCTIYKPFLEALKQPMSSTDQRLVVAKILKSNGNRPSENSIEYYLGNTLEYLAKLQEHTPSQETSVK
jgi:hypothetical protein